MNISQKREKKGADRGQISYSKAKTGKFVLSVGS